MKNKIIIFGLVSALTVGTTAGVLAKKQNESFEDKKDSKIVQLKEDKKDGDEINLKDIKLAITEESAKKIAMDSVVGGIFVEIELDDEDVVIIYEVKVKSGDVTHEIDIDANTGVILKDEIDDDNDEFIYEDVKLTINEAIEIAKKALGGKSQVTEVELEKENGIIVYDIEIRLDNKEFEIEVDANTGEIISQEEDID